MKYTYLGRVLVFASAVGMSLSAASAQSTSPTTSSLPASALPTHSRSMVPVHSQVGPAAPALGTVYYTDSNSSSSPTSFYAYDVATDSWSTKASLPNSNSTQLTTDEIGRVY